MSELKLRWVHFKVDDCSWGNILSTKGELVNLSLMMQLIYCTLQLKWDSSITDPVTHWLPVYGAALCSLKGKQEHKITFNIKVIMYFLSDYKMEIQASGTVSIWQWQYDKGT